MKDKYGSPIKVNGEYEVDPKYTEIMKLHNMLADAKIPHTFESFLDGYQICYPSDSDREKIMDAVQHHWSYGSEKNLLEIMGLLTEEEANYDNVAGSLSADNVFERIENHYLSTKVKHMEVE